MLIIFVKIKKIIFLSELFAETIIYILVR